MQATNRADRRQSPRYRVCQDTLLYNQDSFAEIIDISLRGVACKSHVGLGEGVEVISGVELLNCNLGLVIEGLNCRKVRHCSTTNGGQLIGDSGMICYYAFTAMDNSQAAALDTFIVTCAEQLRPDQFFLAEPVV